MGTKKDIKQMLIGMELEMEKLNKLYFFIVVIIVCKHYLICHAHIQ